MNGSRLAAALAAALALSAGEARANEGDGGRALMPANRERIATKLVERGVVARTATPDQLDAAVNAYLQSKAGAEKAGNRLARKRLDANEEALNTAAGQAATRGRKLGSSTYVAPSAPTFKPIGAVNGWDPAARAWTGHDKLLLLLVEFSDQPFTWTTAAGVTRTEAGPLHNQIKPPDNTYDLWMPNFDTRHYEDMLFTPGGWTIPWGKYAGEKRGSMRDYYLAQSFGRYTVDGDAYGWFRVAKPEAYYGDDDPNGDDLLPGTTWDLVRDTVAAANASGTSIPWADYDLDHNCVLDHVLLIHAGADQSAGGGAQGDDAIWAHSWDVLVNPPRVATTPECPNGVYIVNYTIMPEDGGIGVFAHEFGHDLGLPDEYDTIYSGRGESVAYWSLMSQGSWSGAPAQTQPPSMSIWARYSLGWLGDNLAVTRLQDLGKDASAFRLEQSSFWGGPNTLNALRVSLPAARIVLATPYAGTYSLWGGKADELDARLRRTVDLTGKASATLSFATWYDTEANWDFGFVQVSTDDGATWQSLPIAGTTSAIDPAGMPEIAAQLPGFTGRSGGWVTKTANLSAYAGKKIQLQFRYMTDWGTTGAGWFVDAVSVVADGQTLFTDGGEAIDPAWTYGGWTRSDGSLSYTRYYMAEWRNTAGFDVAREGTPVPNPDLGLTRATQYDALGSTGNPNDPWLYPYNSGLLLWLRDATYADNWARVHPGHGFLLVVDAHDNPIMRPSAGSASPGVGTYPFNTHVQISDATFSLDRAVDFRLGYWGSWRDYTGLTAVPNFDDSLRYWNQQTPEASTFVPGFGLTLRVVGQATDGSAALVGVGRK